MPEGPRLEGADGGRMLSNICRWLAYTFAAAVLLWCLLWCLGNLVLLVFKP